MKTKRCSKCKRRRGFVKFSKSSAKKDGYCHNCKDCQKEYYKAHYNNNKPYYKERKRVYRDKLKSLTRLLKDVPCNDCNKKYPYYVMDFDHLEPNEKSFSISCMQAQGGVSMKKFIAEINKCEVVCSNCHRERTHGERSRSQS